MRTITTRRTPHQHPHPLPLTQPASYTVQTCIEDCMHHICVPYDADNNISSRILMLATAFCVHLRFVIILFFAAFLLSFCPLFVVVVVVTIVRIVVILLLFLPFLSQLLCCLFALAQALHSFLSVRPSVHSIVLGSLKYC